METQTLTQYLQERGAARAEVRQLDLFWSPAPEDPKAQEHIALCRAEKARIEARNTSL